MTAPEESFIVVAVPFTNERELKRLSVLAGREQLKVSCRKCRRPCVVSGENAALYEEKKAEFVCLDCVDWKALEKVSGVVDGQIDSLKDSIRRIEARLGRN